MLTSIPASAAVLGIAGLALGPLGIVGSAIVGAVAGSWLNKILKKTRKINDTEGVV